MNAIQTRAWKVGTAAGVLLAAYLLFISVSEVKTIFNIGQDPAFSTVNTISVSGKGEETIVPDVATFSYSVTENGKTVADAQTKATNRSNAALAALKANGIADKDIKTTAYNINPHYEWIKDRSVLTGYDVSQSTDVKVRDIAKAGKIFEQVGTLGVQNVNNLAFSVDSRDAVMESAQAKAIADARVKAEKLAASLGVRLGKVVGFSDGGEQPYYPPTVYAMSAKVGMDARAAAPELSTGEQKVTSNVSITYEIK